MRRKLPIVLLATGAVLLVALSLGWVFLLPWYGDYQLRAQVSGIVYQMRSCEGHMAAYLASRKAFSSSDCGPAITPGGYISAFEVQGARIETHLRRVHPDLDGHIIFMEAVMNNDGSTRIRCGIDAPEAALRYMPHDCLDRK